MRFATSAVSSWAGAGVLVFFCAVDDFEGTCLPLKVQDLSLEVDDSGAGDWSPDFSGSCSCSISCSESEERVGSTMSRQGFNCKDKTCKTCFKYLVQILDVNIQ